MPKGRKKGGSGDALRNPARSPTKSFDESPTKESPSRGSWVQEPQPKAPSVKEPPPKGHSAKGYPLKSPQGNVEKSDEALTRLTSSKDMKPSPCAPSKAYYPSPRDRNAHTGKSYVPAALPKDEYVAPTASRGELLPPGSPGGYVPPRREAAPYERHQIQTPSGRLYAPYPHRSMEAGFVGGSEAIRQLERRWSLNGDSHQPPTPPTPTLAAQNNSYHLGNIQAPMESLCISTPMPDQQTSDQCELDPELDTERLSPWLPPHQRKRKSEEMGVVPKSPGEEADVLKRSKPSTDQPDAKDQVIAVFENGMRKTPGRGRMNTNYTGVVLPLLDEFLPTPESLARAPWLKLDRNYRNFSDGTARLTQEMQDFNSYMGRPQEEIDARKAFTQKIVGAIQNFLSLEVHEVNTFGSDATGFGLPLSDIDIMINSPALYNPNPYMAREVRVAVLYQLQHHFSNMGFFLKSSVRDEAHIPILEVEDLESGLEMDISFEEPYSREALNDVQMWFSRYGHDNLISYILLLKHSLNIRKLGLGAATMPYQGGVGSYILVCMVVVFLEVRLPELTITWRSLGLPVNRGRVYLAMLKFWGIEFDYETQALLVNPPGIIQKSPYLPVYIFEVRSPFDNTTNIAAGAFGIKHIKETLKHFYYALMEGVQEFDRTKHANRRETGRHLQPAKDFGILGKIVGGNYANFEIRRNRIFQAARRAQILPPHLRVLSGGSSAHFRIPNASPRA